MEAGEREEKWKQASSVVLKYVVATWLPGLDSSMTRAGPSSGARDERFDDWDEALRWLVGWWFGMVEALAMELAFCLVTESAFGQSSRGGGSALFILLSWRWVCRREEEVKSHQTERQVLFQDRMLVTKEEEGLRPRCMGRLIKQCFILYCPCAMLLL